jgi:phenylalanyl-tRNA synthetase alpha chain
VKKNILEAIETAKIRIQEQAIQAALNATQVDVTGTHALSQGIHLHPLTRVIRLVEDSMMRMGFEVHESAEVTTEYLNFDSVNVGKNHPARDMQDTFWLSGVGRVLATHTSSMQNLIMKQESLPIRVVIPGRVFRNEDVDATHENTFYQVEAIVIDKGIHLGHMKYTIQTLLSDMFDTQVNIRLRPSYYPFVEPGADVDFSCPFCKGDGCRVCKKTGWIEFMGCGMIHPNVLREGGIDPEIYTGFAFGF